jgi:hydrogenase maturation factor HypF (carbamoyltransferase family)
MRILVEAIEKLNLRYDYSLFRHEKIPPNDGGLALGQIYYLLNSTSFSDSFTQKSSPVLPKLHP